MTKAEVIGEMARMQMVENIVCNISGCNTMQANHRDLVQDIYCIILDYEDDKVLHLWESGAMCFFVARIAATQCRSRKSQYYYRYRKFSELSEPVMEE
ncbi:MAG: hypothetical protein NC115_12095 [Bacteroidales bacterium]|nr:hypothetical protein [Bacteroidales bacterium]